MGIDEKALNEKLAKWAGFAKERPDLEGGYWIYPNSERQIGLNFTQSLDDCFKYLVPKLIKENVWDIELKNSPYYPNQFQVVIESSLNPHLARYQAQSENPALALCLAIKELIDSELGVRVGK